MYHTTFMGAGTKGVAILSRYLLLQTGYIPVMYLGSGTSWGTLAATIQIGDLTYEVLSNRFPGGEGTR